MPHETRLIVIVSAISPFSADRATAKALFAGDRGPMIDQSTVASSLKTLNSTNLAQLLNSPNDQKTINSTSISYVFATRTTQAWRKSI
ncbi:hypothetical protein, partial [Klebsiella pneumoniae]|uniref:hypothetical protein n=1 Tax=Klebsiella pneumoniae TaxID=573 RepID=UPI00273049DA